MIGYGLLFWLGLVVFVNAGLGAADASAKAPGKQAGINILFLMDDQHRGDWLRSAGAPWMITPNLDRLAQSGAQFRRAYTSVPSCLAARAALLTGMSPWNHGCLGYTAIPPRYRFEGPRLFSDGGWATLAIGKQHFSPPRNTHGFESVILGEPGLGGPGFQDDYQRWFAAKAPGADPYQGYRSLNDQRGGICYPFPEELHETRWTADRAVEFLNGPRTNRPWFLKVSFHRPHAPLTPPQRWFDRYAGLAIPPPVIGQWARLKYGHRQASFNQNPDTWCGVVPDDEIRLTRRSYAAAISFVDEQIGRVLEALEKRGDLENTLILFTSDHGDMMGDHYLYRKTFPQEGSVRVPMILRWPESLHLNLRRGQEREELVELRDVLPTFLDAAGLPRPESLDGSSLLDALRGRPWRAVLDLEHASCYDPKDGWVALMDERYKYIYYELTGEQRLFDLKNDPHELVDLAADPSAQGLMAQWRRRMVEHLAVRGAAWVKDGELTVQSKPILFRANNPHVETF